MTETFKYIRRLHTIRAKLLKDAARPAPSWVRVTTITMVSKFEKELDIPKFRENFTKLGSIRIRTAGSTGPGFEWKMSDAAFYNQVTIGYRDVYSGKSIKLFPNGSIQVAGCSSLFDCRRILKQLGFILKVVLGLGEVAEFTEPKVCMINTNFSLNSSVNLHKIIDKLRPLKTQFKVSFEPDRYSAVMVKFVPGVGMKQVSASIFKTGKIIVTGAQTLDEIAGAYEILNSLITKDMMVAPVASPETFNVLLGWTFEEWAQALENKNMS
jgi:hypothetical protein